MTAFNNATDEFLEDLITAYPNIPVFELLSVLHKKFSEKDIAVPIKRFREHVMLKYGERLRNQDFEFFESEGYEEAPVDGDVIDGIKRLWKEMKPENKESVKAHLKLLVDINDKIPGV